LTAPRPARAGYFVLTAANTLATSYYLNYLFFYLHDNFRFLNRENLWVSALYGFIYTFAAWQCGRFAERYGYDTSLRLGFGSLFVCMLASAAVPGAAGIVIVLCVYSVVLLLTWPALEAAAIAGASPREVPRLVGLYNTTWSSASALAYFTGGALYEAYPRVAVFWLPAGLFLAQFIGALWIARTPSPTPAVPDPVPRATGPTAPGATFLRLAWVANPFSYVAIYTLLPIIPGLAQRLGLSPTETGWFCSVWLFARLAAFMLLWRWDGWHYRFRWLNSAFLLLIISFAAMLMAPALWVLIVAQVVFGLAAGLIYYSSLFYSMDVGEAKAYHGGLHEAAIGVGSFAGPALGAVALHLFPRQLYAGAFAVSGLLAVGWVAVMAIWARGRQAGHPATGPEGPAGDSGHP
jgi:predicted MFS family arabinose efflux permease